MGNPAATTPRPAIAVEAGDSERHRLEIAIWERIMTRLKPRVARLNLHPEVIEAAVRSAWSVYSSAHVQQFREILTERDAYHRLISHCTVAADASDAPGGPN